MAPSMTYFRKALSDLKSHFKRLQSAEPILHNGEIVVSRTHAAIETEVMWNHHRYLLSLPFKSEDIHHLERIESKAREIGQGPLIENIILYDEVTLLNSVGNSYSYDVVLQDISYGVPLHEAVLLYKSEELLQAVQRMKERLDAIGFCHNNLRPANVLLSPNGVARPIRYWYAKWERFSDNDTQRLTEIINQYAHPEHDSARASFLPTTHAQEGLKSVAHEGITRLCKGGRYGFVDSDKTMITRYVYSWASDFMEGRAIVANGRKMGVIDERGKKIIHSIYDNIEFDVETGIFTATKEGRHYLIDYNGNLINNKVSPTAKEERRQCKWLCRSLYDTLSKK